MPFSIVSVCASCASKNRVPAKHLADTGRCGVCKAPLKPIGKPLEVDARAFDEIIAEAKVPVFVDFWASWCAPCQATTPEVHQLAQHMNGRALVLKVNTEAEPRLAERFRVQSIPTFICFQKWSAGASADGRCLPLGNAEMARIHMITYSFPQPVLIALRH